MKETTAVDRFFWIGYIGIRKTLLRACYKIGNYVGSTSLDSQLCKKLTASLNAYHERSKIKTKGISEYGSLTFYYSLYDGCVGRRS